MRIWPLSRRKQMLLEKRRMLDAEIERNRQLAHHIISLTGKLIASIDDERENLWFIKQRHETTKQQRKKENTHHAPHPTTLANPASADSCL